MDALVRACTRGVNNDPVVRSAMAHLNLVMIHPFRDGNGRMARALATLVLTRSEIGEPEFSSIEEWLGREHRRLLQRAGPHRPRVLAAPRRRPAVAGFNLRAHHMQAQTMARRVNEAGMTWVDLEELRRSTGCRSARWRRCSTPSSATACAAAGYLRRASVTEQTATRDLASLAAVGILAAHGNGRGRYYAAGEPLQRIQERRRARRTPMRDPYPWMQAKLGQPAGPLPPPLAGTRDTGRQARADRYWAAAPR